MRDGRDEGALSPRRSSKAKVAVVAGLIVFAVVIGRWMTTPFDDWVPLVAPDELPLGVVEDDLPASARFECSQPLGTASNAVASAQAEEALTIQGLSRAPCDGARAQYRVVGVLNLVVIALALAATLLFWRRRGTRAGPPVSVATN